MTEWGQEAELPRVAVKAAAVETLTGSACLHLPAEVSTLSTHCAADPLLGTSALIANRPREPSLGRVLWTMF